MIVGLFGGAFLCSFLAVLLNRLNSNNLFKWGVAGLTLNSLITGVVAGCFFFFSNGCRIDLNGRTLVYALIFGLICLCAQINSIVIYALADVVEISIVGSVTSIIAMPLFGALFFAEPLTRTVLLRMAVMALAAAAVAISQKKKVAGGAPRRRPIRFASYAASFVINCSTTLVNRAYAADTLVTDDNSYFFMTNMFLLVIAVGVMGVLVLKDRARVHEMVRALPLRGYVGICANCLVSNVSAVLMLLLLAMVNVAVYSPVNSALGIIATGVASVLLRERLNIWAVAALLLSGVALIL